MREKFLFFTGVALLLFGMIGAIGIVGVYVYVKPYFDNAQAQIIRVTSYVNQALNNASNSIHNAATSLYTAADQIDILILGWRPFGPTAESLRKTGDSLLNLEANIANIRGWISERLRSIPSQIDTLRLGFTILVAWIATLHILLALTGSAIIKIGRRLSFC
ncbi:MAG: hypothetical protein QW782_10015 [Candidatus Bathyarchaeia archaeon]